MAELTQNLAFPEINQALNLPPSLGGQLNFDPEIQPHSIDPSSTSTLEERPQDSQIVTPTVVDITEEEVHDALRNYVDSKCCYGSPDDIRIRDIQMKSLFKYTLKTCTEMRKTQWKFEAHTGQTWDTPASAQGAWDVPVKQTKRFKNEKKKVKVPGTSSVRQCHFCFGMGRNRCTHCMGMGFSNCIWCSGVGSQMRQGQREQCTSCNGNGRRSCTWCSGTGFKSCRDCRGKGQLLVYLELTVTWKIHIDQYFNNQEDHHEGLRIPPRKLTHCNGICCFKDTKPRLYPLSNFPEPSINQKSRVLLQKHRKLQNVRIRILEQTHDVKVIPLAIVDYTCQTEVGKFCVYGDQHEVFFPDYPHQSCCSIL